MLSTQPDASPPPLVEPQCSPRLLSLFSPLPPACAPTSFIQSHTQLQPNTPEQITLKVQIRKLKDKSLVSASQCRVATHTPWRQRGWSSPAVTVPTCSPRRPGSARGTSVSRGRLPRPRERRQAAEPSFTVFICAFLRLSLKALRDHALCRTAQLSSGHSLPRVPRGCPVPPHPTPPHRTPPEGERTPRPAGRAGGSPPFCPRAPSGSEQRPEGRSEGSASRTPGHAAHPAHPSPRPAPAPSRTAGPHALTRRRLRQGGRCRVSAVEPRHAPAPRSPLSPPTHRLLSLSRTAPAAGWGPTRGNGVALPQGRPAPLTAQRRGPVSRRETSAGTARGTARPTALPATSAGTPPRVGRGRLLLLPPPRERGTGVAQGARDNHVPRSPVLDSKVPRNQAGLGACRAVAPGHF